MLLQSSSSITVDDLLYTVGDHVCIRNSSNSKGAGSEGIVVSIAAKMTRLNTGHSTKHKHIKLIQSRPKHTVKKNAESKFNSKKLKSQCLSTPTKIYSMKFDQVDSKQSNY